MRQWWMLQPYKHCLALLWQSCLASTIHQRGLRMGGAQRLYEGRLAGVSCLFCSWGKMEIGAKWRLVMFPKGRGEGAGTHLSLYLACISGGPKLPLKTDIVSTVHGKESLMTRKKHEYVKPRMTGFPRLVSLERQQDEAYGHLVNDTLRVSVKITKQQ